MLSDDFLTAKVRHAFDLLDTDGDGVLTEADHVLMGRRSAEELHRTPDPSQVEAMVAAYRNAWQQAHQHHADSEGRLLRGVFVDSVQALFADAALADEVCEGILRSVLSVADLEGTGEIAPDAYRAFVLGQTPRLPREEIEESFRRIDRDGNGVISKDELKQAVVEYFTSDDPEAPGNWLFGRPPAAAV
ncbi:EF-hand domain-containing protein [Streptomyces sp. SGAir0957]